MNLILKSSLTIEFASLAYHPLTTTLTIIVTFKPVSKTFHKNRVNYPQTILVQKTAFSPENYFQQKGFPRMYFQTKTVFPQNYFKAQKLMKKYLSLFWGNHLKFN